MSDEDAIEELIEAQERLEAKGWPPSLAKAALDEYSYVLELRNGSTITFSSARETANVEFVHLDTVDYFGDEKTRGIDVRLSDIVICADMES